MRPCRRGVQGSELCPGQWFREGRNDVRDLAFSVASAVLLVIPGPTILLILSYALGRGWSTAMPLAFGVALGDFTAMTLSLLGVGALLASSAALFTALKWVGAAYLVWLGIKLWRAGAALRVEARTDRQVSLHMVRHAWLVTTLNPKGILFFVAFLPQFVDPARPFWVQAAIFEATFIGLAFVNAVGYAWLGAGAGRFASSPRAGPPDQPRRRQRPDRCGRRDGAEPGLSGGFALPAAGRTR